MIIFISLIQIAFTHTIAIHFGYTNINACILENGNLFKCIQDQEGIYKFPSRMQFIDHTSYTIGNQQETYFYFKDFSQLIGENEINQDINLTQILRDGKLYIEKNDIHFEPIELLSLMLMDFKDKISEFMKEPIFDAVFILPKHLPMKEFYNHIPMSGFTVVKIVENPIAVAIAHNLDKKEGRYLVFHYGGETMEASVVESRNGIPEVFESSMTFCTPLEEVLRNHYQLPLESLEKLKSLKEALADSNQGEIEIDEITITKQEFDEIVQEQIKTCLKEIKILSSVNGIILEGGQAEMASEQVQLMFDAEILREYDSSEVSCRGGAQIGWELENYQNKFNQGEIYVETSYGIEIPGKIINFIIQKGEQQPIFPKTIDIEPFSSKQKTMKISIYQGIRPFVDYCIKIGEVEVPAKNLTIRIDLNFQQQIELEYGQNRKAIFKSQATAFVDEDEDDSIEVKMIMNIQRKLRNSNNVEGIWITEDNMHDDL